MQPEPLGSWINFPDSISRIHEDKLAVIVFQSAAAQLHAGIAYQYGDKIWLLDLAWHHNLRNNPFPFERSGIYWAVPNIEQSKKILFGHRFWRFGEKYKNAIPYAPGIPYGEFDENGNFIIDEKCNGFTCASLVAFLFAQFGHRLIDWETWVSRPEDSDWITNICRLMKEHAVPQEHINKVVSNKNAMRLRPEEVAAASGAKHENCSMEYCEPRGKELYCEILQIKN